MGHGQRPCFNSSSLLAPVSDNAVRAPRPGLTHARPRTCPRLHLVLPRQVEQTTFVLLRQAVGEQGVQRAGALHVVVPDGV